MTDKEAKKLAKKAAKQLKIRTVGELYVEGYQQMETVEKMDIEQSEVSGCFTAWKSNLSDDAIRDYKRQHKANRKILVSNGTVPKAPPRGVKGKRQDRKNQDQQEEMALAPAPPAPALPAIAPPAPAPPAPAPRAPVPAPRAGRRKLTEVITISDTEEEKESSRTSREMVIIINVDAEVKADSDVSEGKVVKKGQKKNLSAEKTGTGQDSTEWEVITLDDSVVENIPDTITAGANEDAEVKADSDVSDLSSAKKDKKKKPSSPSKEEDPITVEGNEDAEVTADGEVLHEESAATDEKKEPSSPAKEEAITGGADEDAEVKADSDVSDLSSAKKDKKRKSSSPAKEEERITAGWNEDAEVEADSDFTEEKAAKKDKKKKPSSPAVESPMSPAVPRRLFARTGRKKATRTGLGKARTLRKVHCRVAQRHALRIVAPSSRLQGPWLRARVKPSTPVPAVRRQGLGQRAHIRATQGHY